MGLPATSEKTAIVNSSTSQAMTYDLYTVPQDKAALLTEVVLTTDAAPANPLRVSLKVSGVTQWSRLVNNLQPTVWRNSRSLIQAVAGQVVQLVLEQTVAVQALHYSLTVLESPV